MLEHKLHPLVMFGIVPVFGLASAGVTIGGVDALLSPLPLGIAAGLFIGKQLGVFGAIWAADRIGLARKPDVLRWSHIYGAALLCGVGFTMSLFIGELAFDNRLLVDEAKIGTLLGSLLSGIVGYAVLTMAKPFADSARDREEAEEIFGEDAEEDPTVCNDPYASPLSPPR
jgi:NhaA family Na+:H+ antiporter